MLEPKRVAQNPIAISGYPVATMIPAAMVMIPK